MATGYVAIVDDDESLRRAMTRVVRAYSFQVQAYASGREFLDSLTTRLPSCLILDLQMGSEMSGFELLEHLADRELRIPTIILTAQDEPEVRRWCELAGAVAFLVKPYVGDSLREALRVCTCKRTANS